MSIDLQSNLEVIGLPDLSVFGNDVLHVITATPLYLSPNGNELVVAVTVNTSSAGQKTEYVVCDTVTRTYERNLSSELGQGDSSTVNMTAIDAQWINGLLTVAVAYEDLLADAFDVGYSNRLAIIEADGSFTSDVIETATGEVANGAITSVRLLDNANQVVMQTSATNLLATATDANDCHDIYALDRSQSTVERISVLADGTELSANAELIDAFVSEQGLNVVFETTAAEFSSDDSNAENDVLLASAIGSVAILSEDTASVAQGAFAENTLVYGDDVFFVSESANITTADADIYADIFRQHDGINELVSTAFDGLDVNGAFSVQLVEAVSATKLAISVEGASLNGVDVSGQLLMLDHQHDTLSLISTTTDGSLGDDVSLNYLVAENNIDAFVYQTYASNLAGYVMPAMVTNIVENTNPQVKVAGSISDRSGNPFSSTQVSVTDVNTGSVLETGLTASGDYDLTISQGFDIGVEVYQAYSEVDGAVTVYDALDALKIAIGLNPSSGEATPYHLIAADIDQNGSVSVYDALDILKTAIGLTVDNPPQWVFVENQQDMSAVTPADVNYASPEFGNVSADMVVDFTAVLLGDVDNSLNLTII